MNLRPSGYEPDELPGWSSPVARQAHNLKVVGSNPTPATKKSLPTSLEYTVPIVWEILFKTNAGSDAIVVVLRHPNWLSWPS